MRALIVILLLASVASLCAEEKPRGKKVPGTPGLPPRWGPLIQQVPPPPQGVMGPISSSTLSGRDLETLTRIVQAGHMQAFLCGLAARRSSAQELQVLGKSLDEILTKQNAYLAELTARRGAYIEGNQPALEKKVAQELEQLSGLRFDKEVTERILEEAQHSAEGYQALAGSNDEDVRTRAQELLPVAKANLQLASRLAGRSVDSSAVPAFRTERPAAPREEPPATPAPAATPPPATPAPAVSRPTPPPRPEGPRPIPAGAARP